MRPLVLLLALGLCVVGVAALPAATAEPCDGADPQCVVDFVTMKEECMAGPVPGPIDDFCWAP